MKLRDSCESTIRNGLVAFVLIVACATGYAAEMEVRGRTVATNGHPLPGVSVQAFRSGEVSRPVTTGSNGEYVLRLPRGAPIKRIEYRHSALDLAEIVYVSGAEPQHIVKVFTGRGSRATPLQHPRRSRHTSSSLSVR